MPTSHFFDLCCVSGLVFSAVMGVIATCSPRLFGTFAGRSSRWVDSQKYLAVLDKPFNFDHRILPHSRVFGCLILASVSVLSYVFIHR